MNSGIINIYPIILITDTVVSIVDVIFNLKFVVINQKIGTNKLKKIPVIQSNIDFFKLIFQIIKL